MIRFILVQNKKGQTRLEKWYVEYSDQEKKKLSGEVLRLVSGRNQTQTNFLEFRNYKLIYKRFANLFFTFCVDINDSELLTIQTIDFIVFTLDSYFKGVTETDLVYNLPQFYSFLDLIIIGGEMVTNDMDNILKEQIYMLDLS